MLGVSGMLGSSGDGTAEKTGGAAASGEAGAVGASTSGGLSEEDRLRIEESERNSGGGGGNRWPRQETLALLQIRSDMDTAFRDSSLKGPLWDEVSRKLAALGYNRSAKKCKEKFENVYKYHKRTKEGRSSKSDGKTYRFFEQLEALENQPSPAAPPLIPPPKPLPVAVTVTMPAGTSTPPIISQVSTIPSTTNLTNIIPSNPLPPPPQPITTTTTTTTQNPTQNTSINPSAHPKAPVNPPSIPTTSSSSTSSDEEPERRRKRKRKWESFFQRLMRHVIDKQEEMQKKFLETLERRERERVAREDAWRVQEMARMNREHEILAHERSMAAAKDAAVIAFLQKQVPNAAQIQLPVLVQPPANIPAAPPPPPSLPPPTQPQPPVRSDNGGGGDQIITFVPTSSSRWPKAEVEALIKIRTNLDAKYQENGPKGPLWEEISAAMGKLGYSRNPKRCKEKWENINKYFKKVKESNKKRPEDSKTCPYFHQLDAIYREKATKTVSNLSLNDPTAPIMVQPEQQWPLSQEQHNEDEGGEEEEDDDDEDEEEEAGNYEVVANKGSSAGTV